MQETEVIFSASYLRTLLASSQSCSEGGGIGLLCFGVQPDAVKGRSFWYLKLLFAPFPRPAALLLLLPTKSIQSC